MFTLTWSSECITVSMPYRSRRQQAQQQCRGAPGSASQCAGSRWRSVFFTHMYVSCSMHLARASRRWQCSPAIQAVSYHKRIRTHTYSSHTHTHIPRKHTHTHTHIHTHSFLTKHTHTHKHPSLNDSHAAPSCLRFATARIMMARSCTCTLTWSAE